MERRHPDKLVIGITGSIATGKSLVTSCLRDMGAFVIDGDQESRVVLAEEEASVCKALSLPSPLDRASLSRLVFTDENARDALDAIVHPRIRARLARLIAEAPGGLVFVDIPLLYETSCRALVDRVILVYADRETEIVRLMARDGISRPEAERKIATQEDIEDKKGKAEIVIDNRRDVRSTRRAVAKVYRRLKEEL